MRNNRFRAVLKDIFFFLFAITILASCKDSEDIGLDVQPANDKQGVYFTDTLTMETSCEREDSIPSDETDYAILGTLNDPIFGKTNAGFCTQFMLPTSNVTFPAGSTLDSVVLSLDYVSFYGDTLNPLQIQVYELSQKLYKDSAYFSDRVFSNKGVNLAVNGSVSPRPSDSVMVGSDRKEAHLRIKLIDNFGNQLMSAGSNLSTTSTFQNFFYGLQVVASQSVSGAGSLLFFDLLSKSDLSKITVYYKSGASALSYSFKINSECARVNSYTHDYSSSTSINNQLANPALGQTSSYIQPLAGLKIHLKMPSLIELAKLGKISINKAELVVSAESTNSSDATFTIPAGLDLYWINDNGKRTYIYDYLTEGASFYGGTQNTTTKQYSFNIARHLQAILSGELNNNGFYLVVRDDDARANRIVINGGGNKPLAPFSPTPFKLKLTYTKIQ